MDYKHWGYKGKVLIRFKVLYFKCFKAYILGLWVFNVISIIRRVWVKGQWLAIV